MFQVHGAHLALVDKKLTGGAEPNAVARRVRRLCSSCAAIAVVGVAGVLAFSVSSRTREFGIRLALGSERRQLLKGVIAEGAVMATLGVLAGAAFGFVASRLAGSFVEMKMPGALPVVISAFLLMTVVWLRRFCPQRALLASR